MAHAALIALMSVVALPVPANPGATGAPPGTPQTEYCLRVDPPTGSRMETIQCRTREDWADLDVNVDKEWAQNGVRTIA